MRLQVTIGMLAIVICVGISVAFSTVGSQGNLNAQTDKNLQTSEPLAPVEPSTIGFYDPLNTPAKISPNTVHLITTILIVTCLTAALF